ncbi:STAS domain-containing protein [Rubellicoccus peritrichatus]|uniref:Anti-sigma factor antagonist n=1 Tax=Rubellicoccus peritrichatus TaxID=3080537 RepID=A0AAQ3LDB6_9BACT|nr:STAS domain-containing protein [Puniceicoccus sp. CR14]WOO42427.1 STAS domain-containing protein [Puniceicoccus sp. CR14]
MQIRVFQADQSLTHLALQGRMDSPNVQRIENGFLALTAGRGKSSIIELEDVSFMVSVGMRMLIEAAKGLKSADQQFILVGPKGLVEDALRIAKLDTIFTIVETAVEALDKINHEAES